MFIEAITLIALSGSAAHERRRSDVVRSVKTLDQLTIALQKEVFDLKRVSVYLGLLPRNASTKEGKRNILTTPVKHIRPSNSKLSDDPSILFARASINYLEELAGLIGQFEVTIHSQDDECKVPIGITAANKQAPLIMHMEYQIIKIPDHDFMVASGNKLIPSVI